MKQNQFADKLNNAKKYVVSTTLKKLDWKNSTLIKGDVVQEIQNLKMQDGPELHVHGSSVLLQTLLRHKLIDELRLKIFPLSIGYGKRLFASGTIPASFRILSSKITPKGVVVATYVPDGEIRTGLIDSENQARVFDPKK